MYAYVYSGSDMWSGGITYSSCTNYDTKYVKYTQEHFMVFQLTKRDFLNQSLH